MIKFVFWFSILFIFYAYIGYPLILYFWAKIRQKPVKKEYIEPAVSIIIAAYNEEKFIGQKIENCLALNYPRDKFELIVISDGSEDQTNEIVRRFETRGVRFDHYSERRGKAFALNLGISQARGEILFFTDARQILEKNSLRELVANFNDSSVAAASGELFLLEEKGNIVSKGVGVYWKVEKWMRRKECQISSILGATGSIYCCRKEMVKPIPPGTILDDVLIPFRAILRGYRSVFDPEARAFDNASDDIREEFTRKIRTLSGNYQLIALEPSILNPLKNPVFFQFISHKIARLLVPFFMIILFISNLFLTSPIYITFLGLQIAFYSLALVSKWGPNNFLGSIMKSFNVIFMMNCAALISFFRFMLNPQKIKWEKTS